MAPSHRPTTVWFPHSQVSGTLQPHSAPKPTNRCEIADNKPVTSITSRIGQDHPTWLRVRSADGRELESVLTAETVPGPSPDGGTVRRGAGTEPRKQQRDATMCRTPMPSWNQWRRMQPRRRARRSCFRPDTSAADGRRPAGRDQEGRIRRTPVLRAVRQPAFGERGTRARGLEARGIARSRPVVAPLRRAARHASRRSYVDRRVIPNTLSAVTPFD